MRNKPSPLSSALRAIQTYLTNPIIVSVQNIILKIPRKSSSVGALKFNALNTYKGDVARPPNTTPSVLYARMMFLHPTTTFFYFHTKRSTSKN